MLILEGPVKDSRLSYLGERFFWFNLVRWDWSSTKRHRESNPDCWGRSTSSTSLPTNTKTSLQKFWLFRCFVVVVAQWPVTYACIPTIRVQSPLFTLWELLKTIRKEIHVWALNGTKLLISTPYPDVGKSVLQLFVVFKDWYWNDKFLFFQRAIKDFLWPSVRKPARFFQRNCSFLAINVFFICWQAYSGFDAY